MQGIKKELDHETHSQHLRDRIKRLAGEVKRDTIPIRLARALREVRDLKEFKDWGFKTFAAYVRADLGWCKARAYHLIHLLNELERVGMSEREIDEVGSVLGWAKCLDILPVLTRENKDRLIYALMTMKRDTLRAHVKVLRQYVKRDA